MVKRVRVTVAGESLSLATCGVTIPLTLDEARQLSSDLSASLIQAGHTIWKRKQAEDEAARLAAQASQPWGLWSGGEPGMVYLGVDWPGNIVAGPLPFDEAEILRDEHNAALDKGEG